MAARRAPEHGFTKFQFNGGCVAVAPGRRLRRMRPNHQGIGVYFFNIKIHLISLKKN
jgi:hypothetical protein